MPVLGALKIADLVRYFLAFNWHVWSGRWWRRRRDDTKEFFHFFQVDTDVCQFARRPDISLSVDAERCQFRPGERA